MKIDYTKGKEPKYLVSIYGWDIEDSYYFHYYEDAKQLFESIRKHEHEGAAVSLYDLKKDVRRAFARL